MGSGANGVIGLAMDKAGKSIVYKKSISLKPEIKESIESSFEKEHRIIDKLKKTKAREFVITETSVEETSDGTLHLLMTLEPNGTLEDFSRLLNNKEICKKFNITAKKKEKVILEIARQLLIVVSELNKLNIVHADFKPANIMLSTNGIKIIDFGAAVELGDDDQDVTENMVSELQNSIGTIGYTAPEVCDTELRNLRFKYKGPAKLRENAKKIDCFSVGVVLYDLLTGSRPIDVSQSFNYQDAFLNYARIITDKKGSDDGLYNDESTDLKKLITGLLKIDPSKRIASDEAVKLIEEKKDGVLSKKSLSDGIDVLKSLNYYPIFQVAVEVEEKSESQILFHSRKGKKALSKSTSIGAGADATVMRSRKGLLVKRTELKGATNSSKRKLQLRKIKREIELQNLLSKLDNKDCFLTLVDHTLTMKPDGDLVVDQFIEKGNQSLYKILFALGDKETLKILNAEPYEFNISEEDIQNIAIYIAYRVISGLNEAYQKFGIIHNDLDPSNIIVMPDGTVKISDFGVTETELFKSELHNLKGHLTAGAPEMFSETPVERRSKGKRDVWAIGVMLNKLFTKSHPVADVLRSIKFKKESPLDHLQTLHDATSTLSEETMTLPITDFNNFLKGLLIVDTTKRSSLRKANDQISDLFKKCNVERATMLLKDLSELLE